MVLRILLFVGVSVPLLAQQGVSSASLRGRVEDSTGAALPGVEVLLENLDRGQTLRAVTGAAGEYIFLSVAPASHQIQIRIDRFAPFTLAIQISVGQELDVPVRLQFSGQGTSITVSAIASVLETSRSEVAGMVRLREIDALPLNGRNYLDLALLVPGVSRTNTGVPQQFAETSAVPGTGISFSSQRNLNNNFVLDGLSLNDDAAGLAGTYISQEVVREFQTVHSGSTAEFGRASAGVINVGSRSGGSSPRCSSTRRHYHSTSNWARTGTSIPAPTTGPSAWAATLAGDSATPALIFD